MKPGIVLPFLSLLICEQPVVERCRARARFLLASVEDSEDRALIRKVERYLVEHPHLDMPTHEKELGAYLNEHRKPHEIYYTRKRKFTCHPCRPRYIHFL